MAGAEWFFAGHMFATPSHSGVAPRGTPLLADLAGFGVPIIAIGGVRPEHTDELRAAGAFGFAAIRGIWDAPDPGAAAKAYLQAS
jgi:thiazole tautomerase (transcriptional regulator TenI)